MRKANLIAPVDFRLNLMGEISPEPYASRLAGKVTEVCIHVESDEEAEAEIAKLISQGWSRPQA